METKYLETINNVRAVLEREELYIIEEWKQTDSYWFLLDEYFISSFVINELASNKNVGISLKYHNRMRYLSVYVVNLWG